MQNTADSFQTHRLQHHSIDLYHDPLNAMAATEFAVNLAVERLDHRANQDIPVALLVGEKHSRPFDRLAAIAALRRLQNKTYKGRALRVAVQIEMPKNFVSVLHKKLPFLNRQASPLAYLFCYRFADAPHTQDAVAATLLDMNACVQFNDAAVEKDLWASKQTFENLHALKETDFVFDKDPLSKAGIAMRNWVMATTPPSLVDGYPPDIVVQTTGDGHPFGKSDRWPFQNSMGVVRSCIVGQDVVAVSFEPMMLDESFNRVSPIPKGVSLPNFAANIVVNGTTTDEPPPALERTLISEINAASPGLKLSDGAAKRRDVRRAMRFDCF